MFERETETIINTVKQRIPHSITDSSSIVMKDILAADIPLPLKTFFRADVEILLTEELSRHWKNSRFNFFHTEVQSLQHQINSFLVLHYAFRKDEFSQRLDDAVHLLINYFIRPQWTLVNVIFEQDDAISSSKLMRLLRYFSPYDHIRSLILRYIEERHVSSFTRTDFSTILWKVDSQFVRRKTGDQLAKILTPLFEFIEYPMNIGNTKIPIKGIIKHFSDKGLATIVRRLEDEMSLGTIELSRLELGEMLESVRRSSGAFEVQEPVQENDPVGSTGREHASLQTQMQEPEEAELPPPMVEILEDTFLPRELPAVPVPSPGYTDSTELHKSTQMEPTASGEKHPFLLYTITEGERRKFIKRIFKQDEMSFLTAIRKIDELSTWRQASVYIDEIFIQNDVDPYSSEAIRFIDVIQEKYYPKK